jgi:hypothetical protein
MSNTLLKGVGIEMSLYNNNKNNDEEILAVLSWNSTFKTSTYSPSDLRYMRKPSGNGSGYLYYNSHRDRYEFPRQISLISKKKLEALQTRSASLAQGNKKVVDDNNNINNNRRRVMPAHLRLHQILSGGPGYSIRS